MGFQVLKFYITNYSRGFSQILKNNAAKYRLQSNLYRTRKFHRSAFLCKVKHGEDAHSLDSKRELIAKDATLIASMVNIFPSPRNAFKNFYHLSTTNLKKDYDYSFKFDRYGKSHEPAFVCNLELKGPLYKQIYGYGRNKKEAEAAASLKALNIFFKNNLMDQKGRPPKLVQSLMDQKGRPPKLLQSSNDKFRSSEKALFESKPLKISLNNGILEEAETLLVKYETNIKPLLEDVQNKFLESGESDEDRTTCDDVLDLMTCKMFEGDMDSSKKNIKMVQHLVKINEAKDKSLPIYNARENIIDSLNNNSVVIIEGGTGCGKSTQIPQIILNDWIENGEGSLCNVIIAQPRRIAAKQIAQKVARERFEKVGNTVGYKMRLEEKLLQNSGGLMFYTCGTLREMIRLNPLLKGISHVIIDEVHERSVDTDLLLLLMKRALNNGAKFKLILMSATARIDDLVSYFNTECVIRVPSGTLFPVKTYYINELESEVSTKYISTKESLKAKGPPSLNINYATQFIRYIHKEKPEGAILVFLPGWNEIMMLKRSLENIEGLWVLPLHSKLDISTQTQVFEEPPDFKRKVILSTNIAETSLTINDVVYVVDSGLQNESRFNPYRNISTIEMDWITKSNAIQRMGRAGRVQPGELYRLYDEETFNNMEEYPNPEIFRLPLESVALRCKFYFENMSVQELLKELLNPPLEIAVENALGTLQHLQLLKRNEGVNAGETLTPLGKISATISTSPYFSKPLIYSGFLGCVEPTLNYVCLENQFTNIFVNLQENTELRCIKQDYNGDSDILAVAGFVGRILKGFKKTMRNNYEDYIPEISVSELSEEDMDLSLISPKRIHTSFKVRKSFEKQLIVLLPRFTTDYLLEFGTDAEYDLEEVKDLTLACFTSASNMVIRCEDQNYKNSFHLENGPKVHVHSSSVLSNANLDVKDENENLFISTDLYRSQVRRAFIARDFSWVSPVTVALFYGEDLEEVLPQNHKIRKQEILLRIKNRNVIFSMDERTSNCVLSLRKMWNEVINVYTNQDIFDTCTNSEESDRSNTDLIEFAKELRNLIKMFITPSM